jgi:hypothetical protein
LSNLNLRITPGQIVFSRDIRGYYLEVCDWWTPIILIIFVTCLWGESQDHQLDNPPTFYSLWRIKCENKKLSTTLFLAFSIVLHLMLLLLILPTTLYTNHLKHVETSCIVLRLTFSVCNISWYLVLPFLISVAVLN